jgi:hypothetical protein
VYLQAQGLPPEEDASMYPEDEDDEPQIEHMRANRRKGGRGGSGLFGGGGMSGGSSKSTQKKGRGSFTY